MVKGVENTIISNSIILRKFTFKLPLNIISFVMFSTFKVKCGIMVMFYKKLKHFSFNSSSDMVVYTYFKIPT